MFIAFARTVSAVLLATVTLSAAEYILSLDRQKLVSLVDQRATALLVSRASFGAADAEVDLAHRWSSGPTIEFGGGYRFDTDEEQWDREIAVFQRLDLWRHERIALASANRVEREARMYALRSEITATAFRIYLSAVLREQQERIHAESVALHKRLVELAAKRENAGDIGSLQMKVVRIAYEKGRAAHARAVAAHTAALTELRILLGISTETHIKIADTLVWELPSKQGALEWNQGHHPSLQHLASRRQRAGRAIDAARADGRPELELGVGYEHEEGADIARLGIGISFGAPGRADAQMRVAMADQRAAAVAYEQQEQRLRLTVAATWKRYQQLHAALIRYTGAAQTNISDIISLAEGSYEAGHIPLGDLLSLKRELLDARFEELELKHETANAALETAAAAALPPFNN